MFDNESNVFLRVDPHLLICQARNKDAHNSAEGLLLLNSWTAGNVAARNTAKAVSWKTWT